MLPIFILNCITPDKRLLSIFLKSPFTDDLTVEYPRTSRKCWHFNEGHIVNCILDFLGLKFSFGLPIRVFFFLPWPLHSQDYVTIMPFFWNLFSRSFFPHHSLFSLSSSIPLSGAHSSHFLTQSVRLSAVFILVYSVSLLYMKWLSRLSPKQRVIS